MSFDECMKRAIESKTQSINNNLLQVRTLSLNPCEFYITINGIPVNIKKDKKKK